MTRRALVSLLAASLVASCGGPSAASAPPPATSEIGGVAPTLEPPAIDLASVPARVHVESAKATAAWAGPAGTTLTTTAEDGTAYRLEIPEGAVPAKTAITMTPITAIDELGLSGGVAGAVYLQPAGLELAATATLTITTDRTAPDGTRLAGFDVGDDGATVNLIPVEGATGQIAVAINHFSAPGAAFGTSTDLSQLVPVNSGSLAQVMTELLTYDVLWDATDKGFAKLKLVGTAWGQVMRGELLNAKTDALLIQALADWRQFVFLLNLYDRDGNAALAIADGITYDGVLRDADLTSLYNTGRIELRNRLQEAIDGNKARCLQSHDLVALANTFFWAHAGERYVPDEPGWLDRASGCAEIALPVSNMPVNLAAGGSDSTNLQFAIEFSDGAQVVEAFEVKLSGSGLQFRTGQPDLTTYQAAQASLTESVSTQQGPPYELAASACWIRDGILQPLCSRTFVIPFGQGATQPPAPTVPPATGAVGSIAGNYSIAASCNSVPYGVGSGQITQSGNQVQMSWTASLNPDPDAARDSLCWTPFARGQFPTSGTWSGTLATVAGGAVITFTAVANSPCNEPARPAPATMNVGFFMALPVGGCVGPGIPVQYKASFTGP